MGFAVIPILIPCQMASNTRTSPHDQDRIIAQLEQALAEQNQKIDQLAQRITLQDQRINLQSQTIDALNSKVAAAAEKTHKHGTSHQLVQATADSN